MRSEVCGPHAAKMEKRGGGVGALAPGLWGKNEGGREGGRNRTRPLVTP